jgi:hypothetical protein
MAVEQPFCHVYAPCPAQPRPATGCRVRPGRGMARRLGAQHPAGEESLRRRAARLCRCGAIVGSGGNGGGGVEGSATERAAVVFGAGAVCQSTAWARTAIHSHAGGRAGGSGRRAGTRGGAVGGAGLAPRATASGAATHFVAVVTGGAAGRRASLAVSTATRHRAAGCIPMAHRYSRPAARTYLNVLSSWRQLGHGECLSRRLC